MSGAHKSAALVIPVYRNAATIPDLISAIEGIAAMHAGKFEAIFVVDGSPDDSIALLVRHLPVAQFTSRLIVLSRNFGSFAAIREGLRASSADMIAVMAADLQEPPDLIPRFLAVLASDEADVAFGERVERGDPWQSRIAAAMFWRLYQRFVQRDMPVGGVDVFAITSTVRDHLLTLESRHTSLVGQLVWLGFRRVGVPYTRRAREHGVSAWTLRKKIDYLLDSVFAFSDFPIRALTAVGGLGVVLCVVAGLTVLIARLIGDIAVPGYTPIMLLVLFFAALNLFGLGVIGSYVFRAFEAAKQRPGAVVMREIQYEGQKAP